MLPKCILQLAFCGFASAALAQSTPTFQTGATNVLVDVVVIGPHHTPVDGLARDRFTVFEDGKPQQIVSFAAHSPATEAPPADLKLAAGVYTNAQTVQDNSVDVLLIDALNTPNPNQVEAHRQLLAYLKDLPPAKPVAVFLLNTRLQQVEDFTTDHTALLRAVDQSTRSPHTSSILKTEKDAERQMKDEDDLLDLSLAVKGHPGLGKVMLQQLQQFKAEQDSFNLSLRVQYTLSALQQLARYLSGMPGRKNLLWLSGSFPTAVLPDFDLKHPTDATRDFSQQIDRAAALLARARVAVYPIDARGLFPPALARASTSGGSASRNPDRIDAAASADLSQHSEEQMTLEEMAHVTGGEAIGNTNDLKGALAEVDRDGAHYYTLAYQPSNSAQNNKLRRIEVRVQPGRYHLAYRRNYVAAPLLRAEDTFSISLQHAVPASTQIVFRITPVRAGMQPASAPLAGSNANVRRPVTRYKIAYDVDASPLQLKPANGVLQGQLTLVVIAYDRNGTALNSASNALALHVPAASLDQFLKHGIQYSQELDVPAQAAWLRAGMLDQNSGQVGSLELPLSTDR